MVKRQLPCFLFLIFVVLVTHAQQLSTDQFDPDYAKADHWIKTNSQEWQKMEQDGYDIHLAKAIVFPELLRYNRLRDKIELFGLQVLYIQFGKDYADFSIGPFQMKPSFVEKIEAANKRIETKTSRKGRIELMNTTAGQFMYLRKFIHWMDKVYANKPWHSMEEKIRFYATAYNSGYKMPEKYITSMLNRKYFRLTETSPDTYSYSAIAAWYYHKTGAPENNQFVYLYHNNSKTP